MKNLVGQAILVGMLVVPLQAQAELVWFSRANCINNESITWDWPWYSHWLWTNSSHWRRSSWEPTIVTGWEYTYRSAAVHWGEGRYGGYFVRGHHWRWLPGWGTQFLGVTETTHCNLGYFFPS